MAAKVTLRFLPARADQVTSVNGTTMVLTAEGGVRKAVR